jgi:uncharacterized repeat protein (TIGR01451 family)
MNKFMRPFFIFCLLFVCLYNSNTLSAQCYFDDLLPEEQQSLIDLYNATDGDNWINNYGWLDTNVPLEDWDGIITDTNCHIVNIWLMQNGLSGTIPNTLNLPYLLTMHFDYNQLNGSVPDFTNLPNLQQFSLANNQLSGNIPNFTNLPNLQKLYLIGNQLSGNILNFTNLPNLTTLYLTNNQLSGNIPNFTNLPNLQWLNLVNNQLSGNIPNFTNLPNLQYLYLSNNQLSGSIPNFTNLPYLQNLYLDNNQLSGNIPNFTLNLQELNLSHNQLSGNILNFTNLSALQYLYANNNQLSSNIPNFTNLPNLQQFYLNNNQLSGNIPNFTNLPNLQQFYLNNNQLSGSIPDFTNLPNLYSLYLANNQLSGDVPNFANLPNLIDLGVCPGNNLNGFIPNFENCFFFNVNAIDFSCVRSVHLIGTAYYDINNNCQQDTDEPAIPNALIQVNGGEHYAYTNNNGNYHIGADVGTYTLSVQVPNALWDTSMVCTNTFSITTENYGDTLYQNFALQANILCSLLSVDIGTAELRPCFSSNYNVQYCNQGTLPEDAAYIDITLPDALTLQTADLPYTQPQAGVYRFEVGDLAIGQCHSFTFTVLVDCGATLGTTACVLANINPIPDCWSSLVDGYQLAVSGDCNGNEVLFTIENLSGDMPDSTQYRIYQDDILSAVGNVKLQSMEQKNISITGNGSLYRLVVKNNSTSIYASDPQALVANCGGNSQFGAFLLNVSEGDDSPFFERDCQIIIGSYDPNDKQAVPRGIGEQHIVAKNEEIEFKIRFQNTGTADAINIFILDTLDLQNLDFSTLRMGIVSHEYTTELTGNVLRINFDNIHLPDSTTNEPASHGFVKYHIRTKSNLNGGEIISNTANIYFDYNAPITTNTTQHTINQAPAAIDDNTEVLKNEATLLNLIMNDINDEGTPQISGFTAPIHGTLSALNNQLLYLPNPNYLGTDVFSYFITDYFGETDTATVVLQVVNALIVGDIPPQTFSLYPNPTQGQLSVVNIGALHTNANAQFLLFDVVGRQVFSTTLSAQNSTILQLGQLPTALYSYKIVNQQNETLQTGKLTVMNY